MHGSAFLNSLPQGLRINASGHKVDQDQEEKELMQPCEEKKGTASYSVGLPSNLPSIYFQNLSFNWSQSLSLFCKREKGKLLKLK